MRPLEQADLSGKTETPGAPKPVRTRIVRVARNDYEWIRLVTNQPTRFNAHNRLRSFSTGCDHGANHSLPDRRSFERMAAVEGGHRAGELRPRRRTGSCHRFRSA